MFRRIRSEVVDTFKTALRGALNEGEAGFAAIARERTRESMRQFDELCRDATSVQANFDTSQKRDKVSQDLSSHIINLQAARLSELRIQLADKRIHVGPWGGNGGDPWEFIPDGRITHIHIRCGKVIDAISFNYIDSQGNNHQSSNFGGSEGALTEVRFAYDEEIINIKGRVGGFGYFGTHTVITSLTFVTNRATYGPYGNHNGAGFFIPEGIDFSLPLSKGRIIGFYGKSSIYLENFGVVLSS
ncbi:hypothetical protein QVD17_25695 [Tagetes erecta]|uniref:Jacalin-type lectin domain-containing protein n=1 Tax=Tagetes erecta TaxID=13708 RepID=A0AAD8KGU1_TARER|nr:hypothetical protein QVD17_25695 [Tagetes erecta]